MKTFFHIAKLSRKARSAKNIIRCQRGVAATEFALAIPFLVILLLGGFEISRYIILHQKLEKIAYTVADVVAQSDSITIAQLNQTAQAAGEIMDPYDFSTSGVVIVSSVHQPSGSAATVRWQYSGGGELERDSEVGEVNNAATLPANLLLNNNDNIIIAEVFFRYQPLFSGGAFADFEDVYKVTIFKPRLGALTTPPV